MFAFGTNDFGTNRCDYGGYDGCRCLCELSATDEGDCTRVIHEGYRLYKYPNNNIGNYYLSRN